MAYRVLPTANNALEDAMVINYLSDDHDYGAFTSALEPISTAKFFGAPMTNEVLGLLRSRVASKSLLKTFTCVSGLAVGKPVRISAADTVAAALADTEGHARVFAFCRYKPSSTTCYVEFFQRVTGLSGGTFDAKVYLQDDGSYGAAPGTYHKIVGRYTSTTEAFVYADALTAEPVVLPNMPWSDTLVTAPVTYAGAATGDFYNVGSLT